MSDKIKPHHVERKAIRMKSERFNIKISCIPDRESTLKEEPTTLQRRSRYFLRLSVQQPQIIA
jgi:hypothetical protein